MKVSAFFLSAVSVLSAFYLIGCKSETNVNELLTQMPKIPDISKAVQTEKGEGGWGWTLTEYDIQSCGLDKDTKQIITWEFRDRSENPAVIEKNDGTRIVAPIECTHNMNWGLTSLYIGIYSIPYTGMSPNGDVPIASKGVNPNLRLVIITDERGGQISPSQSEKLTELRFEMFKID